MKFSYHLNWTYVLFHLIIRPVLEALKCLTYDIFKYWKVDRPIDRLKRLKIILPKKHQRVKIIHAPEPH